MSRADAAIVGSGFGGTILARALHRRGLRVVLIERERHPRFALGESSTPLAAISLERLAEEYSLADLAHLATYGRWQRHLGHLACGLKRGFTFYDHRGGDPRERERAALLVAASPADAIADTHWLRSDVDQHLVERAREEGVEVREGCTVRDVVVGPHEVTLTVEGSNGRREAIQAGRLIDASGAGGLVKRHLGVPEGAPLATRSSLLFSHFAGVAAWHDEGSAPPYPPHRAAVHHLIDEGWIYELRFDDGRVSAGALLNVPPGSDAEASWHAIIERYPALSDSFGGARALRPLAGQSRLQHRLAHARGPSWVALPHTLGFVDPLFSTGIAWSLRGVERLAAILARGTDRESEERQLARYDALLQRELAQIDSLVAGAYAAMPRFELFAAYALTYFAAVSWAEMRQRLLQPEEPMWEGFLGVGDPRLESLYEEARAALPLAAGAGAVTPAAEASYRDWVLARICQRDLAGLDRYGPGLVVPVDFGPLLDRAELLGLDRASVESRLPLLRGDVPSP